MKPQTIKQHENNYYHIPKLKGNPLYIFAVIGLGILAYLNLKLLDWDLIRIIFNDNTEKYNYQFSQLINIYPIIVEYIIIVLLFICLVKIFKKKLKNYKEEGLIGGLIVGSIGGLIVGSIVGLMEGLMGVLIGGLMGVLIIGLIVGLMGGLIGEFD